MDVVQQVLAEADRQLPESLARLFDFLRISSISTDPAYSADCRRAAHWLAEELNGLGIETSVKDTPGHPVVMGSTPRQGDRPHVLFYGHYDVQPVDPLSEWHHPPFEPQMIELQPGRQVISARGACDDKGQVMTFVEACRAWKKVTGALPLGLTVLIEGEEENGSINLPAFVKANAEALRADLALVCDTGMWDRATPAITTSLRGMVYEEIIVRCADRDLHSGHFGGAAANPIHVLANVIASLRQPNGQIAIPGFYDGVHPLPDDVRERLAALNLTEAEFLGQIGLAHSVGESDKLLIEQISTRPTCDVNGIWGGYTGAGTKTVIAGEARAKISFRLVGDQDPAAIQSAFRAFVRERIPADCQVDFIAYKGSRALQLPWASPALKAAEAALAQEWEKEPALVGSGGSIPIVGDFKRVLGMDTLLVGFALDDDRVHSPNEKYDLSSFHKGMRSWIRILSGLQK